ncbi:MAG: alanine--tRNA ligase, partial [Gammaproteobacteria bacterium]|nr:alanine--tRNA ligase [Gammaproteobacteria bacterium]
ERITTVLQGIQNIYDTDLMQHLVKDAAQLLNVSDLENKSLRVIADHIRSTSFLIVDGVTPSNEGRGYVFRRIIRRAIRHGYQLGHKQAFFHKLVGTLVDEMGDAYPELKQAQSRVEQTLKAEGERFAETLEQGIKILDQEIASLEGDTIPGDVAFRLYDTFGFPADLTADVAREQGLQVEMEGFETELEKQRTRSSESSQFKVSDRVNVETVRETTFMGYEESKTASKILNLYKDNESVDSIAAGDEAIVVLEQTPFYAESGGQVGDAGKITTADSVFEVSDTQYVAGKMIGHIGRLHTGQLSVNDKVDGEIIDYRRQATRLNHSATHLLHAALKKVLGDHVQQKGSLVEAARLRFDFSHTQQMTPQEIIEVDRIVNTQIRANHEVSPSNMKLDEAKAAGAEALFGEKYDNDVRVISMGDFSLELCGGTHVSRTGDIGTFKITSESGIASGVRRIEAVTGQGAFDYLSAQLDILDDTAQSLKSGREEIPDKVTQLLTRNRKLEREVQDLHGKLAAGASGGNAVDEQQINGVKLVTMRQDGVDTKSLRAMLDRLREKVGSGVVLLASASNDKVSLIVGVTKDCTNKVHAGNLIKAITPVIDGSGGGRPDMAQGGGSNIGAIDDALQAACDYIREQTTKS